MGGAAVARRAGRHVSGELGDDTPKGFDGSATRSAVVIGVRTARRRRGRRVRDPGRCSALARQRRGFEIVGRPGAGPVVPRAASLTADAV